MKKVVKKVDPRQRRLKRTRRHLIKLGVRRLCVYRTNGHIYAQVFSETGAEVLAQASSLEDELQTQGKALKSGKIGMAKVVGQRVAERALKKGISKVAFDRAGYQYHGRVKALAEGAREAGLAF